MSDEVLRAGSTGLALPQFIPGVDVIVDAVLVAGALGGLGYRIRNVVGIAQ